MSYEIYLKQISSDQTKLFIEVEVWFIWIKYLFYYTCYHLIAYYSKQKLINILFLYLGLLYLVMLFFLMQVAHHWSMYILFPIILIELFLISIKWVTTKSGTNQKKNS